MGKKSFLIYLDYKEKFFDLLTKEQIGELILGIVQYEKTREVPEFSEVALKMAFNQIKDNLDRDYEKWIKRSNTSKENGKKGGRPKIG